MCVRGSVCAQEGEQVLEISPPKNLAIWSSTCIPKESGRKRQSQERERVVFSCQRRQQVRPFKRDSIRQL